MLPCLVGVKHPRVQHTVKLQRDIVCRDGALAWDLNRVLLQALDVSYPVDEGDQDSQTRLQYAVEFSHALDDPCCLLRNEPHDSIGR